MSVHMADQQRISKTLSYWLRHRPDEAGLTLDAQGWTSVDDILAALAAAKLAGDIDALLAVVEQSDKQRFELTPDLSRIRARQGHSVEVDLALAASEPPAVLYHGTVERFLEAIMADGLRKMARHHVHLSPDLDTAQKVGARRGRAVILEIDAAAMRAGGHIFYVTENKVWLTDAVPPHFLRRR
jgi:putative RNA 2'-phosphotransferase